MPVSLHSAALAGLLAVALATPSAFAQNALAPGVAEPSIKKPKPAVKAAAKPAPASANRERRPGELEGWESGVTAPVKTTKKYKPADAISEKATPDGGLPLPQQTLSTQEPPIGFDKGGNVGTNFKF